MGNCCQSKEKGDKRTTKEGHKKNKVKLDECAPNEQIKVDNFEAKYQQLVPIKDSTDRMSDNQNNGFEKINVYPPDDDLVEVGQIHLVDSKGGENKNGIKFEPEFTPETHIQRPKSESLRIVNHDPESLHPKENIDVEIIPTKEQIGMYSKSLVEKRKNELGDDTIDEYFTPSQLKYYDEKFKDEDKKARPKLKDWKILEEIGRGSFGNVFSAFDSELGRPMAVKQVLIPKKDSAGAKKLDNLLLEIDCLSRLNHENIVAYYGASRDDNKLNIFLEFVGGGSLESTLKEYGSLGPKIIKKYTKQILSGLEYLHYCKIIHRDIKAANILVNKGVCKLTDFGASKKMLGDISSEKFKSFIGTPYWMAPEVITQKGHDRFADIWSLGCTVYEMLTSRPPWSDGNEFAAMNNIVTGTKPPKYPDGISNELIDFLDCCFQRTPSERLNAYELQQHPFLKSNNNKVSKKCSENKFRKQSENVQDNLKINVDPESPSVKLSASSQNFNEEKPRPHEVKQSKFVPKVPNQDDIEAQIQEKANEIAKLLEMQKEQKPAATASPSITKERRSLIVTKDPKNMLSAPSIANKHLKNIKMSRITEELEEDQTSSYSKSKRASFASDMTKGTTKRYMRKKKSTASKFGDTDSKSKTPLGKGDGQFIYEYGKTSTIVEEKEVSVNNSLKSEKCDEEEFSDYSSESSEESKSNKDNDPEKSREQILSQLSKQIGSQKKPEPPKQLLVPEIIPLPDNIRKRASLVPRSPKPLVIETGSLMDLKKESNKMTNSGKIKALIASPKVTEDVNKTSSLNEDDFDNMSDSSSSDDYKSTVNDRCQVEKQIREELLKSAF